MKLRAEHLIKKYKSRTVVKDVSLNVEHCRFDNTEWRADFPG